MIKIKHPYLGGILYGLALISFTIYVLLDTFVIERSYLIVPSTDNSSSENQTNDVVDGNTTLDITSPNVVVTDTTYVDANMSITITEFREYDTTIYVADVIVSDPSYLKTAFAKNTYGKNVTETTSTIADSVNAILSINGDFYGSDNRGYVLRNGILYRDIASNSNQEDLLIGADGSFSIQTEDNLSSYDVTNESISQILSFGPALINETFISVTENDEVDKAMTSNPRTAIGILDDLHYVFVVSDGRTRESAGLTLYQLATFMNELGCTTAYNLDGGGSSTMVFNGIVMNKPTTNGKSIKERKVSDIVYIGY